MSLLSVRLYAEHPVLHRTVTGRTTTPVPTPSNVPHFFIVLGANPRSTAPQGCRPHTSLCGSWGTSYLYAKINEPS